MSIPADLLLISWNRRDYYKRTLENLLESDAAFRLYCWDNGSKDGAADILADIKDERIAEKHFCPVNVMQGYPTEWFLEKSQSNIIGKIDDDTIVPHNWIDIIGSAIQNHNELGMIGCWTFWPDDFKRNHQKAMKKIVQIGSHRILHNCQIGGTAFLMRKSNAIKYFLTNNLGRGFPIDRIKMTKDGLYSGWYYPLVHAEHMDDPRSTHCLMNRPNGMAQHAALTAKRFNITTPDKYQKWIMNDADSILSETVDQQLKKMARENSFLHKLFTKIKRFWA